MDDPFDKMTDTASDTPPIAGLTLPEYVALVKALHDEQNDGMRALFLLVKGRFETMADSLIPVVDMLEDTIRDIAQLLMKD